MAQFTGKTSTDGTFLHRHGVNIDENGNGTTTLTIGKGTPHTHSIKSFDVKPAGVGPHDHTISQEEINKIKSK